jgi:hypothetical protein
MPLSRRHRTLAALVAAFGLLLAQLAVAAYACPGEQAMAMAAMDADAPCCGEAVADPEPALCAAHCQQGDRSLDKPATPTMPAMAMPAMLRITPATGPPDAGPSGDQPSLLARPTAPPLAVRHCCFRI